MLAGSTSGLTFSPPLSHLPCRLRQAQQLFVRGHFTAHAHQARGRISLAHRLREVESQRDAPGRETSARDAPAMSNTGCLRTIPPLPSLSRAQSSDGVTRLARSTTLSAPPELRADKSNDNPLAGIGSLLDTQDRQRHSQIPEVEQRPKTSGHASSNAPLSRHKLLQVMLTSETISEAWGAYQELLVRQSQNPSKAITIPYRHLHRLARLLASTKPRTRTIFLQFSSVLTTLQRTGGRVQLWEWNTLIDSAGKQWRKTSLADYKASLNIYNNKGILPLESHRSSGETPDAELHSLAVHQAPDIWTYTTLLSVASRSRSPLAIRHASSLLRSSGLSPNRFTHLCLLRYFTHRNELSGVRSTLHEMKEQGLEVGLDGINACMWAYARNGHIDVALTIYRVLRNNVEPELDFGEDDVDAAALYLRDVEGLNVPSGLEPDEITYTAMIQALAYHGDLIKALNVFVDMLSSPKRGKRVPVDQATGEPLRYKPSMAAFRGIFLGFVRHARKPNERMKESFITASLRPSSQAAWNLENLQMIFTAFLELPEDAKPSERLVYWIIVAFGRTSGNDLGKLREVWVQLEDKYGGGWGGRLERIRTAIYSSGDGEQ
jgi:pentatricopeptide repeat protein